MVILGILPAKNMEEGSNPAPMCLRGRGLLVLAGTEELGEVLDFSPSLRGAW